MVDKKRKFNFIDIIIILVVIAGVLFGLKKYKQASVAKPVSSQANKILISYYIEEVPDFAANSIVVGDPVREEVQNSNFGKVTDVEVSPSVSWARNDKGEFFRSSREGYASVILTMEANGIVGENGVTIDKSVYYVGQTVAIYAGNSILKNGRISDIKVLEI